ncbi:N-hydroxyarylamine O-acetyltransferase [Streptomyces sp. TLI_235]|nr:arylamine N-acetyltransferase [Streptomyces sp. TLI_235]PBC76248.1 N-hydroxyarylamine O-acetyltransferase [Streptomyces sp. TLI_235]
MDGRQVAAYLDRIGLPRPGRPDAAALRALQLAHLSAVPFETLSVARGEPIVLTEQALWEKLVERRRGGFCYELNGAFAALLGALGYRVELLAARVFGKDGRVGPPFDHMALRVELDGPWLVDVGFGRFSHHPLRLDERGPQADPAGRFTLAEHGPGLDVLMDGDPQYRLDLRPYALADFGPTCWWQATSPDSHFTRSTTCSRLTAEGRITLAGTRLIRTGADGSRSERELTAEQALAAYREHFGIGLDELPVSAPLRPARH